MTELKLRPGVDREALNARAQGSLPGLVGFRVAELAPGRVRAELALRPELLAGNGYLHAASVVALADTACGYGCFAHMPEGARSFTTLELKCNFIGTAREGVIECVATPAHAGRTTQVWDAEVTNAATGKVMALFRATQLVIYPR